MIVALVYLEAKESQEYKSEHADTRIEVYSKMYLLILKKAVLLLIVWSKWKVVKHPLHILWRLG